MSEDFCVICHTSLKSSHEVTELPDCHHRYHKHCIDRWLDQENSCPFCRKLVTRVITVDVLTKARLKASQLDEKLERLAIRCRNKVVFTKHNIRFEYGETLCLSRRRAIMVATPAALRKIYRYGTLLLLCFSESANTPRVTVIVLRLPTVGIAHQAYQHLTKLMEQLTTDAAEPAFAYRSLPMLGHG
eukprot:TRINITY_DN6966_c0_g1_i2.p2 TRINITY_DN6966_c0_g1~~TRINITY_DN6966_c0_g1_i2.p2  ORF type:complete len:187 (+),score=23.76 TRINITY_DN6966_c0_g1_i2:191-751(+)